MKSHRIVADNPDDTEAVEQAIREVLEENDEELVAIELEPLSREQHESNQALVEYLEERR